MELSNTIDIFRQSIFLILQITMPMMLGALIVGLIIAIFQATTQIQEQTLAFVPKIIVIFLMLILLGPWILSTLYDFTYEVFLSIATVI